MRLRLVLPLALLVVALAGCGSDSSSGTGPGDGTTPATTVAETTTPATTVGTTTAGTTTDGIDPLDGASTDPVMGVAEGDGTALLERVAVARHEGYDRVVFQFRNARPGFKVEYVEPPLTQDGSGDPIAVAGNAFVSVRMEPASGFDLATGEGELVYTGPKRISGDSAGTSVVQEVVQTGDFEAVLTWAIGLEEKVDFKVTTLDSPPRLVVDFRNH